MLIVSIGVNGQCLHLFAITEIKGLDTLAVDAILSTALYHAGRATKLVLLVISNVSKTA